jgi:transcriptional regulator
MGKTANIIGFEHLYTQLKVTNKLLAVQLRDKMKQVELIKLLSTTGASDAEIADTLNTTAGTVSVTKAQIKKRTRNLAANA